MIKIKFLCAAVMIVSISCAQQEKKQTIEAVAAIQVVNDLPTITTNLLNGTRVSLKTLTGKNVIVLFQPECDHCQREAKQIQMNLTSFKGYNLYFISSAPTPELKKFADDYNLIAPNVYVGTITVEEVLKSYGPIDAPSLYLYSNEGKLIKQFNGEVEISVVLKYL